MILRLSKLVSFAHQYINPFFSFSIITIFAIDNENCFVNCKIKVKGKVFFTQILQTVQYVDIENAVEAWLTKTLIGYTLQSGSIVSNANYKTNNTAYSVYVIPPLLLVCVIGLAFAFYFVRGKKKRDTFRSFEASLERRKEDGFYFDKGPIVIAPTSTRSSDDSVFSNSGGSIRSATKSIRSSSKYNKLNDCPVSPSSYSIPFAFPVHLISPEKVKSDDDKEQMMPLGQINSKGAYDFETFDMPFYQSHNADNSDTSISFQKNSKLSSSCSARKRKSNKSSPVMEPEWDIDFNKRLLFQDTMEM